MNSSINTVNRLLELEKVQTLFSLKNSRNQYYWDFIRYDILYQLLLNQGIFKSSTHLTAKSSVFDKIRFLSKTFVNEITFLFLAKHKPFMFLTASRTLDNYGFSYDQVMKDLIDNCDAEKYVVELFNKAKLPLGSRYNSRYFLYAMPFLTRIKSRHNQNDYKWIESVLNQNFDSNHGWAALIAKLLNDQDAERLIFQRLFKRIKPKIVFFNRNSSLKPMISEAHEQKIKVVEMQHGSITPASLFYNYNNNTNLENSNALPDLLLTFGSYWNNSVSPHISTLTIGNNEFAISNRPNKQKDKTLTIISGKFVFKELMDFALQLAPIVPHHKIYFKLHPGESEHIAPARQLTKEHKNISIIYDEISVNNLLLKSEAVLLIQSTCSYTALHLGIKVFILKKQYYEESSDIFNLAPVMLISDPSEVKAGLLQNIKQEDESKTEFFTPFKPDVFKELITN